MKAGIKSVAVAVIASVVVMTSAAQLHAITLAENTHVSPASGNNPYSFGTTFGAENFTLGGAATVTRISHVGHHTPGTAQPTSIDWAIYADAAGLPGAVLASANRSGIFNQC